MPSYKLIHGNNLEHLKHLEKVATIFADPPDNIGLGYNEYKDKHEDYPGMLDRWLRQFCAAANTVWLSFNSRWLLEVAEIAIGIKEAGWEFTPCVQTFSFYQNNKYDMGNAHRPLWRFRTKDAGLYPDQAKIESWRQRYGDPRAKGGKVPGDAFDFTKLEEKNKRDWHTRAIQNGEWVVDSLIPDDHFNFTRVVGNSKQRRAWHPTQLNEGLVKRCLQFSSKPGDLVVDPFGGTGTTLRVCRELGDRSCTIIEIDRGYCEQIAQEHGMGQTGDNEWQL